MLERNAPVTPNRLQSVTLRQGPGATCMAAKAKSQLAEVPYRVDIEANGTPHTLASGLKEPAAFAVLSDVSAVLGLTG